jgi:hypothetical protein
MPLCYWFALKNLVNDSLNLLTIGKLQTQKHDARMATEGIFAKVSKFYILGNQEPLLLNNSVPDGGIVATLQRLVIYS